MTQDYKAADPLFAGNSEMAMRMRSHDWSTTSLGAVETWSQSLKTAVRIMLTSNQPMWLGWGEELLNLYNDAYRPILGGKHPVMFARPAAEVWREIWDEVRPRAESSMLNNEGTYDESLLLIMERNGYPEETYYTFSYSPIPDDQGNPGGIICANTDDTQRIIGERQLALLKELATCTTHARTFDEACNLSAKCLESNLYDLPFAMIYLVDADQQRVVLAGTSGIDRTHAAVPETVHFNTESAWSFAEVIQTQKPILISDLAARFGNLPTGAWDRVPHQAVVVPIAPAGQTGRSGILVAGLNPLRLFDDNYRSFIDLVVGQIAASVANANAYEEERRRAEQLAELDRAKTAFFSNVSHEFRTPLTLLMSPLEELSNTLDDRLQPDEREQLQLMQRNGLRLQKLVNTLLDFSRIEAGRVQASYEPTDLAMYTAELASVFRSLIERAGISLKIDCPTLPELVYVDREMWEKIVLNLISNAFKFTFTGIIAVRLQPVEGSVELSVADTGVGIPEAELPRLFERFHRVSGTRSRTYEGSGIGLALVQELVKLHSGTIRVTSQVDCGTTFTIALPCGSAHLPQDRIEATRTLTSTALGASPYVTEALRWLPDATIEQPSEALTSEASIAVSTHSKQPSMPTARILLADDNADMRDYLKRLLSQYWNVETVNDGLAALESITQHPPDLVLSDVMMPGLDGFGLLRELRSNPITQNIPVILLSARAGEEARIEGLEAGADDYLTKPFSARELLARVESNLKLAQLRKAAAQQEQALRMEVQAAKDSLETVLTRIADQFLALDREWCYTYVNNQVTEVTGIARENLLGRSIWELFPDTVDSQLYTKMHRAVAEQTPVQFEYFYPRWNRWFENHVYPSADGISMIITEITDRKVAETEREQLLTREQAAREQAETANRIKDEFLAVLSHELRSPLNPILGWAKLLQQGKLDAARTTTALEIIERNAQLQAQLISDLLDISRILRGKLSLDQSLVDLSIVILSALETVRLAAEAKSLHIQTVFSSDVGTVLGDAGRLQQVVWNLLSNAVKFTPQSGQITITLTQTETHARIQVIDTGKGISAEFLPYVFEHFRQEDGATTRKFGGLGLGLAIARQLVEMHGGQIRVASSGEGQGATFTVQLPLAPPLSQLPSIESFSDSTHDLSGIRILVVDDEPDSREFIAFVLEQAGAIVTSISSGIEALQAIEQSAADRVADLIVSDIGMPEMDGYMLLQQIRELEPTRHIPAIALTAYAGEFDRQQAIAVGFQQHLTKPVEPEALVRTIATLIGGN